MPGELERHHLQQSGELRVGTFEVVQAFEVGFEEGVDELGPALDRGWLPPLAFGRVLGPGPLDREVEVGPRIPGTADRRQRESPAAQALRRLGHLREAPLGIEQGTGLVRLVGGIPLIFGEYPELGIGAG